jgi:hypothetical protein
MAVFRDSSDVIGGRAAEAAHAALRGSLPVWSGDAPPVTDVQYIPVRKTDGVPDVTVPQSDAEHPAHRNSC